MQNIENTLTDFYRFLAEKAKLKNTDPKVEIQKAFETVQSVAAKQEDYINAVKRISGLLVVKKDDGLLT
jgi:hypothetical protein